MSRRREDWVETETHHNQPLTSTAARRNPVTTKKLARKVVALHLDEREQLAFRLIGGVSGLKQLLCPEKTCLCCRQQETSKGTLLDSLCEQCSHNHPVLD